MTFSRCTAQVSSEFVAIALVALAIVFVPRSPLTAADLENHLAIPDVLTERMVIPPNRPDWLVMDCQKNDDGGIAARIRRTVCEARD